MKKFNENIIKGLLFIILFVPVLIGYALYIITSGSKKTSDYYINWTEKALTKLIPQICMFLGIDSVPEIYLQENTNFLIDSKILGIFCSGAGFDWNMNKIGSKQFINNSSINTRESSFTEFTYIVIYVANIQQYMNNHNFFIKLKIILTIAHELTHYKQYLNNNQYNENYIDYTVDMVAYKKQDIEKEADSMSFKFVIFNIIKVLKAIFSK